MNKKDIRAESVRFETVKFRPSKAFKKYVRYQMELERVDKKVSTKKPAVAPEKRKEITDVVIEYYNNNLHTAEVTDVEEE